MSTNFCIPTTKTSFEVRVANAAFKFNAAHFVAFPGFRERLHGHNYTMAVRVIGSRTIGHDGYVIDFGDIKKVCKQVCKDLNEHFLCPTRSDVLKISVQDDDHGGAKTVRIVCEDKSVFVIPHQDCAMLPIVHATAEELAIFLWGKVLSGLSVDFLLQRGIETMEVTVAEAPGQEAVFLHPIPQKTSSNNPLFALDVPSFIRQQQDSVGPPKPCLNCDKGSCPSISMLQPFSNRLSELAAAINDHDSIKSKEKISVQDLEQMLEKLIADKS